MKKIYSAIPLLFILFTSCEEVVDINLNEAPKKLVIEATSSLQKDGTATTFVRLTETTSYYDETIPVVADVVVTITDENGAVYSFTYQENGVYTSSLIPEPEIEYTLEVIHQETTYRSRQKLEPVAEILYVEQIEDGGFSGDDLELKAYFKDPEGEENFYFFEGLSEKGNTFDALSDTFFDGNTNFFSYAAEDLEPGDTVTFRLSGTNEQTYNYLFNLLLQTGAPAGPFETQPATVRGNITNQTEPENFPLGYFRISEVSVLSYTVQ